MVKLVTIPFHQDSDLLRLPLKLGRAGTSTLRIALLFFATFCRCYLLVDATKKFDSSGGFVIVGCWQSWWPTSKCWLLTPWHKEEIMKPIWKSIVKSLGITTPQLWRLLWYLPFDLVCLDCGIQDATLLSSLSYNLSCITPRNTLR
jgi:hypothetical protein